MYSRRSKPTDNTAQELQKNSAYDPLHPRRFSIRIDAIDGVLSYDKFARVAGISRESEGKQFGDWAKEDRILWQRKVFKEVHYQACNVELYYLPSDQVYHVSPGEGNSYIRPLDNFEHAPLYRATVIGDHFREDFSEEIELWVYSRLVPELAGWCISVVVKWDNHDIKDKRKDFKILCDFPIKALDGNGQNDKWVESLGFEMSRDMDTYGHMNEFGEEVHFRTTDFKKNGVSITINP